MDLTVAVVTHLGGKPLYECIESLQRQTRPPQKILTLISNEETVPHPTSPNGTVLHLGANIGYAAAVNIAFSRSSGPLLILNDDVVLDRHCLEELLKEYDEHHILQPLIRYLDDPEIIENAGHRLCLDGSNQAHSRGYRHLIGSTNQRMCFSGAAVLLPSTVRSDTGLFDTALSPFGEDLDYSLRAIRQGFSIRVVPAALAFHKLGNSFGRYSKEKVRWVESHRIQAKLRSLPWCVLPFAPISSMWRYKSSFKEDPLIPPEERLSASISTVVGVLDGYRHMRQCFRKRRADRHHRNDLAFLLHWFQIRKEQL